MIAPAFAPVSATQILRKAGDVEVTVALDDLRLAYRVLDMVLRGRHVAIGAIETVATVYEHLDNALHRARRGVVRLCLNVGDALMVGLSMLALHRNREVARALMESARRRERGAIRPGHQPDAIAAFVRVFELLVAAARQGATGIGEPIAAGEAAP